MFGKECRSFSIWCKRIEKIQIRRFVAEMMNASDSHRFIENTRIPQGLGKISIVEFLNMTY